jgi:hypothetical protein
MRRLIASALLAASLTACATAPTRYQPAYGPGAVGFSEQRSRPTATASPIAAAQGRPRPRSSTMPCCAPPTSRSARATSGSSSTSAIPTCRAGTAAAGRASRSASAGPTSTLQRLRPRRRNQLRPRRRSRARHHAGGAHGTRAQADRLQRLRRARDQEHSRPKGGLSRLTLARPAPLGHREAMERYLLVAAGGAAGAVARYAVGVQASRWFGTGQVWARWW